MGKRGPPPAPTKLKLIRGERNRARINTAEPEPANHAPRMPADLADAAQVVWRRVMGEIGGAAIIRAADQDVLPIYCEAVARYEEAARTLAAVAEMDAAGNIKPSRDKSGEKIDGVAAWCDALYVWSLAEEPPQAKSAYATYRSLTG